ncbi:MAG: GGDEF domain-containing protein, partial [Natronospirillum sp.]
VGDRVIRNLALLLRQRLRKTDILGRYGGEEFGIIMPETAPEDASLVMDGVLQSFKAIRHPLLNESEERIHCSFSGGIAGWQPGESGSDLAIRVDKGLYCAKENGRSRFEFAPDVGR